MGNLIEEYQQKDPRWAMQQIHSPDDFEKQFLKPIYLTSHVHEDIRRRIENVKRILFFSYYEYELLDIANEHLLLTVELALKLRYEEIEGLSSNKNKKTLKPLLDWAAKNDLLEFPERSKSLEYLRNSGAHPRRFGYAGIAAIGLIYSNLELINGLYEDTGIRLNRKDIIASLTDKMDNWYHSGAVLYTDNNSYLIRFIRVMYYRQLPSPLYYVGFTPIDEYLIESKTKQFQRPIPLECEKIEINDHNHELHFLTNGFQFATLSLPKESENLKLRAFDKAVKKEHPSVLFSIKTQLGQLEHSIRVNRFNPKNL